VTARAAVYVRISQDRTGARLGVQRQEQDCRELAARLSADVTGLYVDNDLSASSGKRRPEYERLLTDMRAGLVDVVLVWHTDRLHRRPVELEEFIAVAESRKTPVSVHAVQAGPLDLATPSGRMVARQLGAVARYEQELKAERTKAANLQSARAGLPRGGQRPFGFEDDGIAHRKAEAAALRRAVTAVLSGESLHEVARRWNGDGLLTATGGQWNATTVRQVLSRPRNAGLRAYQGETYPAVWKPLVDEPTWRALMTLLADPARRKGPGNRPKWLLSGIALCGVHGCDLTVKMGTQSPASYRTAKPRAVYRCRSGGHLARDIAAVDDFVTRLVIARLSEPDAVDLLAQETVDLTGLHEQARELRARQESLAIEAAHGRITAAQMGVINRTIADELEQVEGQIASSAQTNPLADLAGRQDVQRRWDELSIDRKRAVVDAILVCTILPVGRGSGRTFDPSGLRITWREPGAQPVPRQRGNRVQPLSNALTGSGRPKTD
jgi:site-specific DNA recombinase